MSVDLGTDPVSRKIRREISVAPWYNITQFKKVYVYLYSSEVAKKRWAIDQISVWETRCHPSLPTAVEASQVVTRAIIQDILLTNGASLCQERDIQLMYAMALIRFVNLTVEKHQKLYPDHPSTTSQIAKGIGIPAWVIELRNEATHSYLPSLPALRMAAETVMKYLSDSYWEKEIVGLKDLEKEPFDDIEIRNLIITYINVQFQILQDQTKKESKEKPHPLEEELKKALRKILLTIHKNKREFVNAVVSEGLFIPSDEDLKGIMSREECIQYEDVYEENFTQLRSLPQVPVVLVELWRRLLQLMNRMQVVPIFLEALLKSQADRTEMGQKLVMAWVRKILKIHTLGIQDDALKKVFKSKGLVVNWCSLFHAAISRPCVYTLYILPLIFSRVNLSENVSRYILSLLAIVLGQGNWKNVKLSRRHCIYTVENLKTMKKIQEATQKRSEGRSAENIWSTPEDCSYTSWPIGFVNNPTEEEAEKEPQPEANTVFPADFEENVDFEKNFFFSNENDNEEEYFDVGSSLNAFDEDEMELCKRESFLYKKK